MRPRAFIRILVLSLMTMSICIGQSVTVKNMANTQAVVTGHAPKRCWLGVTAVWNGREKDFPAKPVSGKFSETYSLSIGEMPEAVDSGVTWIACLWEKKVDNCGCEYCRRNGYHMEGRIARDQN
jgi:hypothetical protein